jgi:5,10-methylenetetrahydromethanopterin reductase
MAESGPFAAQVLHAMIEAQNLGGSTGVGSADGDGAPSPFDQLTQSYRPIYEAYRPADARYLSLHRGHLLFVRPEEQNLVSGELIKATTMTGAPAALRDRLRVLAAAGYDEVVVGLTPGHESMLDDWMRVFERV